MGTKTLNMGFILAALTLTAYQAPTVNETELVARHYNTTVDNLADEMAAAKEAAENDMKLYF